MILLKYAQDILNFLFTTNGSDTSYSDERKQLEDKKVPLEITAEQIQAASRLPDDDKKTDNEEDKIKKAKLREEYRGYYSIVETTAWCDYVKNETSHVEYWYNPKDGGDPKKVDYYGFTIKQLAQKRQTAKYPATRYLALFTKMPNEYGDEYVEPFEDAGGNSTTYCRVNLDNGYFSRSQVMGDAFLDVTSGGASIVNEETIYYPEISGVNWATEDAPIVGFGIFENKDPVDGELPYMWGTLSNTEAVKAEVNHVPLFRTGSFKISIS